MFLFNLIYGMSISSNSGIFEKSIKQLDTSVLFTLYILRLDDSEKNTVSAETI